MPLSAAFATLAVRCPEWEEVRLEEPAAVNRPYPFKFPGTGVEAGQPPGV